MSAEHEEAVRAILSGLWTPDKEVERDAVERSKKIVDERIAESLVAKLYAGGGLSPSDWFAQEVVESLRAQGFGVELLEDRYVLQWPGTEYRQRIPYAQAMEQR